MDPDTAYSLYAFSAIAALLGVAIGVEAYQRTPDQATLFRWAMLVCLAGWALGHARDAGDLLFLIAVPIGCYKLGQMLGEPIGWLWRRWR